MGRLHFVVEYSFEASPRELWHELIDWEAHQDWVPMTHVEIAPGDPHAVGAEFTARTGLGRLALVDKMSVSELHWDDASNTGFCQVAKLGPVLSGFASFEVRPSRSRIEATRTEAPESETTRTEAIWIEDVQVPYLPALLAPVVARVASLGFTFALSRLANKLERVAAG